MHNQRRGHASLVHMMFVTAERCVGGVGPRAPVGEHKAPIALKILLRAASQFTALGAAAIVAQKKNNRVAETLHFLQRRNQSTDVLIH